MSKNPSLSTKEKAVQNSFLKSVKLHKPGKEKPVVIAMIGLVGSGKASISKKISKQLPAITVSADDLRVSLSKKGLTHKNVRKISENIIQELLLKKQNVVIDSDFIDSAKRAKLKKIAQANGAKLEYIRLITSPDVILGRICSKPVHPLFSKGWSSWSGKSKGSVIKAREMWRRTPHHYVWKSNQGGQWQLKKLPVKPAIILDTTDSQSWQKKIKRFINQLK